MEPELLMLIVRSAFMLGTAKVEWAKLEPRVKGIPAEQIPSVLDAIFAESSQKLDKTIETMPEDPPSA